MTRTSLPLRRLFKIVNGGTPTPAEENWGGPIPWATPVDLADESVNLSETQRTLTQIGLRNGSSIVPKGSILLSTRAPIGYTAITEVPMAFNQGCRALVPIGEADTRFFRYQLEAREEDLQAAGMGTTFVELSSGSLAGFEVECPAYPDQRRIANFLDAEVGRIGQTIAVRRRQISGFQERSQSQILAAIRGADEFGIRRESGLRWLGDVPDSWPILAVSYQFETLLGKMLNESRTRGTRLRPYLRNVNVQWDEINTSDLLEMDFPKEERSRYEVQPGDLLVCEGGEPGRCAIWDGRVSEIYYQKALHRVRPRGYSSVRWLAYCMKAANMLNVFSVEGNVTTIAHLTGEQLRAQRFPFPDREIQERILSELDRVISRSREVSGLIEAQIDLLEERKRALITAAVTGQIDVTTARGADLS